MRVFVVRTVVLLFALVMCDGAGRAAPAPSTPIRFYDPDPQHLWNRLHRAIFVRSFNQTETGHDSIDPLLYGASKFCRTGSSRKELMTVLKELISDDGAHAPDDVLKRAIFQRDLWVVFDWAQRGDPSKSDSTDTELMGPAAKIMRQVALSARQIEGLPDMYAQAVAAKEFPTKYDSEKPFQDFLPDDLLSPKGPWVAMRNGDTFAARTHVMDLQGRSAFDVFLNLPGGRQTTLNYLAALQEWDVPLVPLPPSPRENRTLMVLNPKLPHLPKGTQFAIVRRSLLIDREGTIHSTPLIDSIRIRVIRQAARAPEVRGRQMVQQDSFEFVRSRSKLFGHQAGGIRAVSFDELEAPPPLFRADGNDPFEFSGDRKRSPLAAGMKACMGCHAGNPNTNFQSLNRFPGLADAKFPNLKPVEGNIFQTDADAAIAWKKGQKDWQALSAMWGK